MQTGIVVIIILLVPILFQVVYQGEKARKRHEEIMRRFEALEIGRTERKGF